MLKLCIVGVVIAPTILHSTIGTRGNWLKKREWYKQAKAVNQDVQQDVVDAQKQRSVFYDAFAQADKNIDTFYETKGIVQGKLDDMIAGLKKDVERKKRRRIARAKKKAEGEGVPLNFYDVQIEAIEDRMKRFSRDIEQFRLDISSLQELDASLRERLKALDGHLDDAKKQGKKAGAMIEEMLQMLDDKAARTSYYNMKKIAAHVASIREYLQGPLLQDFKSVITKIDEQMALVGKEIAGLERRGLIIEHRMKRMADRKQERRMKKAFRRLEEEEDHDEPTPRRRRKKKKKMGWVAFVLSPFKKFFHFVAHSFGAV